jgi:hypothetical protein
MPAQGPGTCAKGVFERDQRLCLPLERPRRGLVPVPRTVQPLPDNNTNQERPMPTDQSDFNSEDLAMLREIRRLMQARGLWPTAQGDVAAGKAEGFTPNEAQQDRPIIAGCAGSTPAVSAEQIKEIDQQVVAIMQPLAGVVVTHPWFARPYTDVGQNVRNALLALRSKRASEPGTSPSQPRIQELIERWLDYAESLEDNAKVGPKDSADRMVLEAWIYRRLAGELGAIQPRLAKCGHVAYRNHDNLCIQDGCPSAAYREVRPVAEEKDLPDGDGPWKRKEGDWAIFTGELSHSNREAFAGWKSGELLTGLLNELPRGGWIRQS